ncbi:MAG: hypothetical protein V5A45_04140 [Haloarculaceae archaeon]
MNVFSYDLAAGDIDPAPALDARKFVVDDNVGEAVHIHYRNVRFEFSVEDFRRFAEECESAMEVLDDGNR